LSLRKPQRIVMVMVNMVRTMVTMGDLNLMG